MNKNNDLKDLSLQQENCFDVIDQWFKSKGNSINSLGNLYYLDGIAGSGKSWLAGIIYREYINKGLNCIYLRWNNNRCNKSYEKSLYQFIEMNKSNKDLDYHLIILDDANIIANEYMAKLMDIVEKNKNTKLLLVGDSYGINWYSSKKGNYKNINIDKYNINNILEKLIEAQNYSLLTELHRHDSNLSLGQALQIMYDAISYSKGETFIKSYKKNKSFKDIELLDDLYNIEEDYYKKFRWNVSKGTVDIGRINKGVINQNIVGLIAGLLHKNNENSLDALADTEILVNSNKYRIDLGLMRHNYITEMDHLGRYSQLKYKVGQVGIKHKLSGINKGDVVTIDEIIQKHSQKDLFSKDIGNNNPCGSYNLGGDMNVEIHGRVKLLSGDVVDGIFQVENQVMKFNKKYKDRKHTILKRYGVSTIFDAVNNIYARTALVSKTHIKYLPLQTIYHVLGRTTKQFNLIQIVD